MNELKEGILDRIKKGVAKYKANAEAKTYKEKIITAVATFYKANLKSPSSLSDLNPMKTPEVTAKTYNIDRKFTFSSGQLSVFTGIRGTLVEIFIGKEEVCGWVSNRSLGSVDDFFLKPGVTADQITKMLSTFKKPTMKEELEEARKPLTIQQRMVIGRRMKRLAPKLARYRKMRSKRMADNDRLQVRSRKKAIQAIRKRVAGQRGKDYKSLGAAEKISIDRQVQKRASTIGRIAKRLLPAVRKAEMQRLQKARSRDTQKESYQTYHTFIKNNGDN